MTTHRPLRVAVVNDYEIVVAGVAAMLEPFRDRVLVVELDTRMPVVSEVDVVLYDTFAHDAGRALELAGLLASRRARVVVFSWSVDLDLVERALSAGAAGYLSKSLAPVRVVEALEHVGAGRIVGPDGLVAAGRGPVTHAKDEAADGGSVDHDSLQQAWPGQDAGLTPREAEVLALISQGLSNQAIAERSYLSINSVKTYIRSAYRKIGVTSRSQAIIWSLREGFEVSASRTVAGRGGTG